MPSWWKPWFKYQLLSLAILWLCIYLALAATDPVLVAFHWILVGMTVGVMISCSLIWRTLDLHKRMSVLLKNQEEAMKALMESKSSEIGEAFANAMRSDDIGGATVHYLGPRITKH